MNTPRTIVGKGILDTVINNLPFELHLLDFGTDGIRRYNYCGPGTRLNERTTGPPNYRPLPGNEPINGLDSACYKHDISYDVYKDIPSRNKSDKILVDSAIAWEKNNPNLKIADKINLAIVKKVIGDKAKAGAGLKRNNSATRGIRDHPTMFKSRHIHYD